MFLSVFGSFKHFETLNVVHCEWNDWKIGDCSKICGGGSRTNTRTKKLSAAHGGDECNGPTSIQEGCNVQECPGINFLL